MTTNFGTVCRRTIAAVLSLATALIVSQASADAVSDFYSGKTITILVGSSPGGGYDGDARTVARNIGRFIPGQPNVIVQNMPGARGLTSANNLYNIARKDGTFMGVLERVHLVDAYLMPDGVRYDERKFNWIGSTGTEVGVALAWNTAPQKRATDLRTMEFIVGGDSNSATLPRIYNATMGTRFKIITGYPGSSAVILAMEKGEVQGIGNFGLSNLVSKYASWLKEGKVTVLFQTGKAPDTAIPNVPLAFDLALDEQKREILELWLAPNDVARPFAMPPDVPRERVAAVRQAFMAMFKDEQFLSDAKKSGMVIDPRDGETIDKTIAHLRSMPAKVVEAARAAGGE
jgi:tripartite-type tricarboxylate transporter receptor subunit TctC